MLKRQRNENLTPRLKAATHTPVARPSKHPMSSRAHSGGAPSANSSLTTLRGDPAVTFGSNREDSTWRLRRVNPPDDSLSTVRGVPALASATGSGDVCLSTWSRERSPRGVPKLVEFATCGSEVDGEGGNEDEDDNGSDLRRDLRSSSSGSRSEPDMRWEVGESLGFFSHSVLEEFDFRLLLLVRKSSLVISLLRTDIAANMGAD